MKEALSCLGLWDYVLDVELGATGLNTGHVRGYGGYAQRDAALKAMYMS